MLCIQVEIGIIAFYTVFSDDESCVDLFRESHGPFLLER